MNSNHAYTRSRSHIKSRNQVRKFLQVLIAPNTGEDLAFPLKGTGEKPCFLFRDAVKDLMDQPSSADASRRAVKEWS